MSSDELNRWVLLNQGNDGAGVSVWVMDLGVGVLVLVDADRGGILYVEGARVSNAHGPCLARPDQQTRNELRGEL